MRIISVVVIEENIVNTIDSFAICEDQSFNISQLSKDIIDKAEKLFKEKALFYGAEKQNINSHLEDGYYSGMNFSVCICWSCD